MAEKNLSDILSQQLIAICLEFKSFGITNYSNAERWQFQLEKHKKIDALLNEFSKDVIKEFLSKSEEKWIIPTEEQWEEMINDYFNKDD